MVILFYHLDLNRLSEHVEMITEILFSIMLGDERYTGPMSDSIMKLLLVKVMDLRLIVS